MVPYMYTLHCSGLNNDDVSEILDLQCAVNGQPFPCQLIKIGKWCGVIIVCMYSSSAVLGW